MLFKNLPDQVPLQLFEQYYQDAENNNQPIAEAGCISSVDKDGKPHSRFVNFKYFFEDNLIFFSSYSSNKAEDFKLNQNVAINFWWSNTNVQIRLEGQISKCSVKFSDEHFYGREVGKNIAAIVSNQSREIESYEVLEARYEKIKSDIEEGRIDEIRPEDWGGFQISVSYFEFWEANNDRLNYRECYSLEQGEWRKFFLQS